MFVEGLVKGALLNDEQLFVEIENHCKKLSTAIDLMDEGEQLNEPFNRYDLIFFAENYVHQVKNGNAPLASPEFKEFLEKHKYFGLLDKKDLELEFPLNQFELD